MTNVGGEIDKKLLELTHIGKVCLLRDVFKGNIEELKGLIDRNKTSSLWI